MREQKILTRALTDAAARGWLHPAEVHWLVRLGDRGAARRFAGRVAGPHAAKALRSYQQAATEMAFMHDRVLRGTAPPDGIPRVRAHLRADAELAAVRGAATGVLVSSHRAGRPTRPAWPGAARTDRGSGLTCGSATREPPICWTVTSGSQKARIDHLVQERTAR